jgi:putative Mg2+ transporter-C (MgtC) family protein
MMLSQDWYAVESQTVYFIGGNMDVAGGLDMQHVIGLVAALVFGSLIGLERQFRHHPAGLHTTALVALGSAAYVVAGVVVGDASGPARVAGQVVTGVGFLCAGVVMHHGIRIRGINTAATIWCASGVGVLAGLGLIAWSALVAFLVVLANVLLHIGEHLLFGSKEDPAAR